MDKGSYVRALERVMALGDEVVLTGRSSGGTVTIFDSVVFELSRALLDAHRLRERFYDGLDGTDDDVDAEASSQRLQRSQ